MKRIVFSERQASPAFYDMSAQYKPSYARWYGGPFRIGDRAAAYVWLSDWRKRSPHRRLVVVEDSVMPGTEHSRALPGSWLFKDAADELWMVERPEERIARPAGQALYHVTMWRIWRWLHFNNTFNPDIRPLPAAMKLADELLKQYKVPLKFVTIQPLFDAEYDRHRNAPRNWWVELIRVLSGPMPVVVLGLPSNARQVMVEGRNVFQLWNTSMDAMTTLALIAKGSLHVGGATGTTLWAPIFKVPTLACYVNWAPHPGKKTDTRPISFGKPVVYAMLKSDVKSVALQAQGLYNGVLRESTAIA